MVRWTSLPSVFELSLMWLIWLMEMWVQMAIVPRKSKFKLKRHHVCACTFTLPWKRRACSPWLLDQEEVETWNRATPADQLPCDQEDTLIVECTESWGCLLPSNSWLMRASLLDANICKLHTITFSSESLLGYKSCTAYYKWMVRWFHCQAK